MKTLVSKFIFSNDGIIGGLLAMVLILGVGLGCNNTNKNGTTGGNTANAAAEDPNRDPDMPDDRLLKAHVKETTADFSYAISTEDFSKMYSKASADFQQQYTADQMKDVFKSAIANKRQLLPMLAKIVSMDPVYDPAPYVRKEQGVPILVVSGRYDLEPKPLKFNYEYVKRDGKYKLLKLILE